MSKYVEIQTGKLIGRNGGVGSIIETIQGAIKIEPFDNWNYFESIQREKIEPKIMEDKRLLERLRTYFPKIEKMVKVPENYLNIFRYNQPKDKHKIINSRYFPQWMYCTNCERFRNIKYWWEGWRNIYIGPKENIRDSFVPPKCFYCYKDALQEGKKRKYFNLEQVRFIMISPDGKIRDIPWDIWPTRKKVEKGSNSDVGSLKFNLEEKICCDNQDLRYKKSPKLSDLAGIWIECKNCGSKNTLSGLFRLRLFSSFAKGNDGETLKDDSGNSIALYFKPVIRVS